jgi:hypothetical protein
MNDIEEKLWRYIDGLCTPAEREDFAALIEQDATVNAKYRELLGLNITLAAMELDEPPMAFTYNVMETIRTENAMVPLKAAVNKRIIRGISIFFVVTLAALLILVFSSIKWSGMALPANLTAHLKPTAINAGETKMMVQAFIFFDVMLGLYLFDAWLRKKKASNESKMA